MLAKGTAKGVKPKGFAGGYRQGWIFLPVIRCHKHPLLHVAEVSQSAFLERDPCTTWGAWNRVWVKASSYWPTQMVLKAGEMGEGAKQWKQTSKSILVKLFEDLQWVLPLIKEVFCLGLLHPDSIWMNHGMTFAASHSSPELPSPKSNTGILLEESQLWPPDHTPSS